MPFSDPERRSGRVLNLHAVKRGTRVNGPGSRVAIWFQGCTLACPGCFNPDTHSRGDRLLVRAESLVRQIIDAQRNTEGVTVTGGEPLQQAAGLLRLLAGIRHTTRLSIVLFSGYHLDAIAQMTDGKTLLGCLDVLIAGPYDRDRHLGCGLRGSSNQRIHFLTKRYGPEQFDRVPPAEVWIRKDGGIEITGIAPPGGRCPPVPIEECSGAMSRIGQAQPLGSG